MATNAKGEQVNAQGLTVAEMSKAAETGIIPKAPAVITSKQADDKLATINNDVNTWNTSITNANAKTQADLAAANAAKANTPAIAPAPTDTGREKTNGLLEELKAKLNQPNTYNYQAGTATARPKEKVDTELMAAYDRLQAGTATPTDEQNLAYAKKNGWTPQTAPAEAPAPAETYPTENTATENKIATQEKAPAEDKTDLTKYDVNGNALYNEDGSKTLYGLNAELDAAYEEYSDKIDQITNGTFPLSSEEQAQVDQMRKQYDDMIAQQKVANANYEGATSKLGLTSGRSRYAGEEQIGIAKTAIDQGLKKVADLESQALSSIAELKQAIKDKNLKAIGDAYDKTSQYLSQKSQIVKDTQDMVTAQLTQQKAIQDLTKAQTPDIKESNGQFYMYNESTGQMEVIGGAAPTVKRETSLSEVGGERVLIDTQTGEVLANYGSADSPLDIAKYNLDVAKFEKESTTADKGETKDFGSGGVSDWRQSFDGGKTWVKMDMGTPEGTQETPDQIARRDAAVTTIDEILNNPDLKKAVGIETWNLLNKVPGSKAMQARSKIDQLVGTETLKNMGVMKGALSDRDIEIITAASTVLGKPENYDLASYKNELLKAKAGFAGLYGDGKALGLTNAEVNDKILTQGYDKTYQELKQISPKTYQGKTPVDKLFTFGNFSSENKKVVDDLQANFPDKTPSEIFERIAEDYGIQNVGGSQGGGNAAVISKLEDIKVGSDEGQCGHFVNTMTGYKLGLGDAYSQKMSKMDITKPKPQDFKPGQVFVQPYSNTGHTGFILAVNYNDSPPTVTVKDSNYHNNEKISVHKIPMSKITGLANV